MVDYLPGKYQQPSRATLIADYVRDVSFRNPGADVSKSSQPYLDAQLCTDQTLPLYTYADRIARSTSWLTATGSDLDAWATAFGTRRAPAVGAVGDVVISASAGGTYIQAGDRGTCNGFTYKALFSGLYQTGAWVAVQGVDTGPQTNQPAGSGFTWLAPRPGLVPKSAVALQANGTGLYGGTDVESDQQLQQRLSYLKANPAGSGNSAHYLMLMERVDALAIQQAYTIPCVRGPGTIALMFTLRPPASGASRIPNAAQMALALASVSLNVPASDGIFMCTLITSPLPMVYKVEWADSAPGWADASPFPLYQSPGNNWSVTNAVPATPTLFHVKSLTDTTVPQPGQSIGVLDLANQYFARKRILSATPYLGGYTIAVDTSNSVSDVAYAPLVGQLISPWSDSLDSLLAPTLAYFDSVGPGEQFASFFDAGLRQRRDPPSPAFWSSQIANRMIGGPPNASTPPDINAAPTPTLLSTSNVEDVELLEPAVPYQTPVGVPAVSSYLTTLGSLAAFPE